MADLELPAQPLNFLDYVLHKIVTLWAELLLMDLWGLKMFAAKKMT